jgi:hypothetical protein
MAKCSPMPRAFPEALVFVVFLMGGCHKPPQRVLVPPPPAPMARPQAPPELPQPPQVDTRTSTPSTLPAATAEVPAPPPPAPVKVKRPPRRTPTPPPPVIAAPAQPSDPTPEAPQLGQILSPQEVRQLNADIERSAQVTQSSLQSLSGKNLNAQQQAAASQAQSFLKQAMEIRSSDLPSARSLAQRAEVVARDLAASVR